MGNLRREAARGGVDPERLVFAPREPMADDLARHRRADLILDTLPDNAVGTAYQARCRPAGTDLRGRDIRD